MFLYTGRSQEGAQRREPAAEPGSAGREPTAFREARSVPQEGADSFCGSEILVCGDGPDRAAVGDRLVHGEIEPVVAMVHLGAVERALPADS